MDFYIAVFWSTNYSKHFTRLATLTHSHIHTDCSHTSGCSILPKDTCRHAAGAGDLTTDLPISGRLALPPESQVIALMLDI